MHAKTVHKKSLFLMVVTILLTILILSGRSQALAATTDDNVEEHPSSVPAFVYETSLDLAQFDGGRDIALTDYTFDPANSVLQDSITTNTTHEEDTP
jgi:hypothetical protein